MYIRKAKYRWNYKKLLNNIKTAAAAVMLVWFMFSYFEIICKNCTGAPVYNDYNVIVNAINYFMDINGGVFL